MASILDAGLLSIFSGIFTFLLVYAFVWGVLSWWKPFGDKNTGSYAIFALMAALLVSISSQARFFISFIAPWYVAFALVIFFILFLVGMFSVKNDKFPDIIKDPRVHIWIIIVALLIFIAGIAFTFGQSALDAPGGTKAPSGGTDSGAVVIGPDGQPYQQPGTIGVANSGLPTAGQPGSTATSDFKTNMINTIIHPKVLGLLITFLVAAVAVYFLSI